MNRDAIRELLATALFIFGIIISYQGLALGKVWLGAVFITAVVILYFVKTTDLKSDVKHIAQLSILAFVVETLLVSTSVYTPIEDMRFLLPAPLCPVWIFALWVNLSLRLKSYRNNFKQKHTGPFIIGVVFGLMVFHRLEAGSIISFGYKYSLYLCSFAWGLVAVAFFYITNKIFTKKV